MDMDWLVSWDESTFIAYNQLFTALSSIPISHYVLPCMLAWVVFFYNFLEFHLFEDFFSGFRGAPVGLTFHPASHIYHGVVSKCRILHGRYLATPWLSSPHFQTAFLNFFGNPPAFSYRRQLFHTSDGGTIALDWLTSSDVSRGVCETNNAISKDDTTPLVVVIPGLTSDSASSYIKHLAFELAKHGWNVVVSNHRGLGGVSITSDYFYNAGCTEDARAVIDYLHRQCPKAPLFAVGTSIGANILVKYLGEDREKVPVAGAVAICSPWDLVIGDRFICRRLVQKLYDRAIATGLRGYAKMHEPRYSRLANWEGIKKYNVSQRYPLCVAANSVGYHLSPSSRSIRDFDNFATCIAGKFEQLSLCENVSVPLLCIGALDDPICTREAIPWDECRANKNIVLATARHGGHLAFFEGITASRLWWVRAADEFLDVLHSSPHMHIKKTETSAREVSMESLIDQDPYVNIAEDRMVAAVGKEHVGNEVVEHFAKLGNIHDKTVVLASEQKQQLTEEKPEVAGSGIGEFSGESSSLKRIKSFDTIGATRRWLNHLSRQNGKSMWLLAYIAIITSWPILSSALRIFNRKKLKKASAAR
ncbi:protein SCARECROW-like [Hibiscus syriacus]|uniref:Protein SCARECROW-like n=1 Tax=Hibiscus syriacus TaxID=106335 RepID=A0A6A2YV69_HIBSY|nr:protein SCARECROW-like [Hibiscus syriacus]